MRCQDFPANYGGPLIDLQGRVIGILAPVSPGAFLEAIPRNCMTRGSVSRFRWKTCSRGLKRMQAGENIRSGKMGVVASDQNEFVGPVKVAGAVPGSPASKAGVKPGDVLVEAAVNRFACSLTCVTLWDRPTLASR